MSNYATIQVKDELARLEGVGDVTIWASRITACGCGWIRRSWPRETDSERCRSTRCGSRTCRWRPARSVSRRCPKGIDFQYTDHHARPVDRAGAIRRRSSSRRGEGGAGDASPRRRPRSNWGPRVRIRPARSTAKPSVGPGDLPDARLQRPGTPPIACGPRWRN